MKRSAKLIAVLLVAAMFMAFGLTAHAEAPNSGTITVLWPGDQYMGDDYNRAIWKLFDANLGVDESGNYTDAIAYTYNCTEEQRALLNGGGFFHVDAAGNVSALPAAIQEVDGKQMLSTEAAAWLKENIAALGTRVPMVSEYTWRRNGSDPNATYYSTDANAKATVYHNMPWGYYYIESTVGSLVMVDSLHPDAVIQDKNSPPDLEKTITHLTSADEEGHDQDIRHGEDNEYSTGRDSGTAQIGDKVEYTITVTARKGAENYILWDAQTNGLIMDEDSIKVKVDGEPLDEAYYTIYSQPRPGYLDVSYNAEKNEETGMYEHTVKKVTVNADGSSQTGDVIGRIGYPRYDLYQLNSWNTPNLIIVFDQEWLDGISEDKTIEVVYESTVTQDARVAVGSNPNTAGLIYGHDGDSITDWAEIYSAMIVVYKYEGDGDSFSSAGNKPLNGVKFILQREKDGKYLRQDDDLTIHWVDSKAEATEFVTGGDKEETVTLSPEWWWTSWLWEGPDGIMGTADDSSSGGWGQQMFFVGPDGTPMTADDYFLVNYVDHKATITPGPDGEWGTGDEIMRDADGYIFIKGLTNGTYTLIETYALPGYNTAAPVQIIINNQGNYMSDLKYQADIVNHTGTELPTTGGMGVTLFYVLGGMCVLLGAALLTRKKNTAEG